MNLAAIIREGQCPGLATLGEQIKIGDALVKATEQLREFSESPRLDAELLLTQALDIQRSYLFAHPEDQLDSAAADRFFSAIARRAQGQPLAYIHGKKEFWSLMLTVSPDTLVPRPETETLVQEALALIPHHEARDILDLGTGSGAIALAIASERSMAQLVATDISEPALAVARDNARQLELINIRFAQGDWIEPVIELAFDIIVSNPPYVRSNDAALRQLKHEPISALSAGKDGLEAIRVLARQCMAVTKPGGALLLEHGADQQDAVTAILASTGWTDIRCSKDLAGKPRVAIATRPRPAAIAGSHSEGS
jgi:release factor glutamine methyltransferase